jgi:hypothetical protein
MTSSSDLLGTNDRVSAPNISATRGQLVKTTPKKKQKTKKALPTHLRIGRPSEPNGENAFLASLAAAM